MVGAVCWGSAPNIAEFDLMGGSRALRLIAASRAVNEDVHRAAAEALACCCTSELLGNGTPELQDSLAIINASTGKWNSRLGAKRNAASRLLEVRADNRHLYAHENAD